MFRLAAILASLLLISPLCHADTQAESALPAFELENTVIHQIKSEALGRNYDIFIKLPRGYSNKENAGKSYPVIYTTDGPYIFKIASSVTHFRNLDKAIVVGLSFAKGENGMHSRVRDLTPEKDKSWTNYQTGGAGAYLDFLESEVLPFVETTYRAEASRRIYAGLSLSGSFGAWILLTKPDLFESYILTSPSLWFKDRMIFDLEEQYAANHKNLKANVFFATGAFEKPEYGGYYDMVDEQNKFAARLRSRNYASLNIHAEIIEGAIHETAFATGFSKGLLWLLTDFYKTLPLK